MRSPPKHSFNTLDNYEPKDTTQFKLSDANNQSHRSHPDLIFDQDGELSSFSQDTLANEQMSPVTHSERSTPSHEVKQDRSANTWPIIFAAGPPLLSLFLGNAVLWGEILSLALAFFYLYLILNVPWELYSHARYNRILNHADATYQNDEKMQHKGTTSILELKRLEQQMLILFLTSPVLGGLLLHWLRIYVIKTAVISEFHILLFTLAASLKPLFHLISLTKEKTNRLKKEIHYPTTEIEILRSRLSLLETELGRIKNSVSTQSEVHAVRESLHSMIGAVAKAVKRLDRRVEQASQTTNIKIDSLIGSQKQDGSISGQSPRIFSNSLSGSDAILGENIPMEREPSLSRSHRVDHRPSTPSSTSSHLQENYSGSQCQETVTVFTPPKVIFHLIWSFLQRVIYFANMILFAPFYILRILFLGNRREPRHQHQKLIRKAKSHHFDSVRRHSRHVQASVTTS